jgi:multidrug transporter EmrE-like cation transporter
MGPFWWMLLGMLLSCAGEAMSKYWANTGRACFLAAAILAYTLSQFPWYAALIQKNHLSTLGTIWCLGGVLGAVAIGYLLFGEQIAARQWVGIVLAFTACWLLC